MHLEKLCPGFDTKELMAFGYGAVQYRFFLINKHVKLKLFVLDV